MQPDQVQLRYFHVTLLETMLVPDLVQFRHFHIPLLESMIVMDLSSCYCLDHHIVDVEFV